jgi:hypothetical protein
LLSLSKEDNDIFGSFAFESDDDEDEAEAFPADLRVSAAVVAAVSHVLTEASRRNKSPRNNRRFDWEEEDKPSPFFFACFDVLLDEAGGGGGVLVTSSSARGLLALIIIFSGVRIGGGCSGCEDGSDAGISSSSWFTGVVLALLVLLLENAKDEIRS